ncbi:MAG: DUF4974 domain-containing protein [Bacteroides sp.]|nr:DUF4974 domain-containing protein [Bacteroides sp.]
MDITLIHHLINGTLTPSEREELRSYISGHKTKEEFFDMFDTAWAASGNDTSMPSDLQDRIYRKILAQIKPDDTSAPTASDEKIHVVKAPGLWLRIASVCAILILAAGCLWLYNDRQSNMEVLAQTTFTVSADRGQRADVVLPDGTHVWLNSDSRLTYPADYGVKGRHVKLEGEASFKVAKDPDRRFTVEAMGVSTEALGTEFNIRAYAGSNYFRATLYQGSIKVDYDDQLSILEPMDELKIVFPDGDIIKSHDEDLGQEPAWRRDELTFNGESLIEIAEIMRRTFDTEVVITDSSLGREQFVGTISNTSITNFIDIIGLTSPIRYYFEGDTLYIARRDDDKYISH